MRVGVITFPGSLDDRDAMRAIRLAGAEPVALWHGTHDLMGVDAIVLPGGFSYGDYLRCGAIAANSPIMAEVIDAANSGMPVLGICNGFQILIEAGLLPGALLRNAGLRFVCRDVNLSVENSQTLFTHAYASRQVIRVPVAHHDGQYFADEETLQRLEDEGRVAFRYCAGDSGGVANPNGSARDIAGILNEGKTVLGMMPHPEDATDPRHGGTDGLPLFEGLVAALG